MLQRLGSLGLKFLTPVLGVVLDWLYAKVMAALTKFIAYQHAKSKAEAENRAAREAMENAKTKEEFEHASDQTRARW